MRKLNNLEASISIILDKTGSMFDKMLDIIRVKYPVFLNKCAKYLDEEYENGDKTNKIESFTKLPFLFTLNSLDSTLFEEIMDALTDINTEIFTSSTSEGRFFNYIANSRLDVDNTDLEFTGEYGTKVLYRASFGFLTNFHQIRSGISEFERGIPRIEVRTKFEPFIYETLNSSSQVGLTAMLNNGNRLEVRKDVNSDVRVPVRNLGKDLTTYDNSTYNVADALSYYNSNTLLIVDVDTFVNGAVSALTVAFKNAYNGLVTEEMTREFITCCTDSHIIKLLKEDYDASTNFRMSDGFESDLAYVLNNEKYNLLGNNTIKRLALYMEFFNFIKGIDKYEELTEKVNAEIDESFRKYKNCCTFSAVATTAAWYANYNTKFIQKDFLNRVFNEYLVLSEKDLDNYFHNFRLHDYEKGKDTIHGEARVNKSRFVGQKLRETNMSLFNLLNRLVKDSVKYRTMNTSPFDDTYCKYRGFGYSKSFSEIKDAVSIRNLSKYISLLMNKIVEFNTVITNFETNITKSIGRRHYYEKTLPMAKRVIGLVNDFDLKQDLLILLKENDDYYPLLFDSYQDTDSTVLDNYKTIASYLKMQLICSLKILDLMEKMESNAQQSDDRILQWYYDVLQEHQEVMKQSTSLLTSLSDLMNPSDEIGLSTVFYMPTLSMGVYRGNVYLNKVDTEAAFSDKYNSCKDLYDNTDIEIMAKMIQKYKKTPIFDENMSFYEAVSRRYMIGFADSLGINGVEIEFLRIVGINLVNAFKKDDSQNIDHYRSTICANTEVASELNQNRTKLLDDFANSIKNTSVLKVTDNIKALSSVENVDILLSMPVLFSAIENDNNVNSMGSESLSNEIRTYDDYLYKKIKGEDYYEDSKKTYKKQCKPSTIA